MSRQDRRRFEREFKKISNVDNCTICGKPFLHNSKTFGGLTADGKTVLTGQCCAYSVKVQMMSGIYLTQNVDVLMNQKADPTKRYTSGDVSRAIDTIQSHVAELDGLTNGLMRQGGVQAQAKGVFLADNAWKADDAAWFKAHPDRSHRLRPMLAGEADTLPAEITKSEIPPNHQLDILVRQVQPGARIRTVFCRNRDITIPDQEEIIHAIFDTVAQAGRRGIIDAQEINARAQQYVVSGTQQLN